MSNLADLPARKAKDLFASISAARPILAEALERIRRVIDGLTAEVNPSG